MRLLNAATLQHIGPPLGYRALSGDSIRSVRQAQRDSAAWDPELFERATGTPAHLLRHAFFNELGFAIPPMQRHDAARICTGCARLGDHCTLFDLAVLERCPWHPDRPLWTAQHSIDLLDQPNLRLLVQSDLLRPLFDPAHAVARLIPAQQLQIARDCAALVRWWARVRNGLPDWNTKLPLFTKTGRLGRTPENINEQIEMAQQIAGPCPWQLRTNPGELEPTRFYSDAFPKIDQDEMAQVRQSLREIERQLRQSAQVSFTRTGSEFAQRE